MGTEDTYIIAIELGSSKLTGLGGRKLADGTIEVCAYDSADATSFMRNGIIFNLDRAKDRIDGIVKKLETDLKCSVTQVYVGCGGQGLHSVKNEVRHTFDEETHISDEIVKSLMNENTNMDLGELEILETIPQEYQTANCKSTDPTGELSSGITGNFLNIVARPNIHKTIDTCFSKVEKKVAEYKCTPLTLADEVLSFNDKHLGCVLMDMGANTTTVSVYKNDLLRYMVVLPLGSANITKDITSLQIDDDKAEQLKTEIGFVDEELSEADAKSVVVTLPSGDVVTRETLVSVIEARLEEILVNVKDQILASGYPIQALMAGAIITGGGANLKNLTHAFRKTVGIQKVTIPHTLQTRFRPGSSKQVRNVRLDDPAIFGALSVLAKGKQSCTTAQAEVAQPKSDDMFNPQPVPNPDGGTAAGGQTEVTTAVQETAEPEQPRGPKRPNIFKRTWIAISDFSNKLAGDEDEGER